MPGDAPHAGTAEPIRGRLVRSRHRGGPAPQRARPRPRPPLNRRAAVASAPTADAARLVPLHGAPAVRGLGIPLSSRGRLDPGRRRSGADPRRGRVGRFGPGHRRRHIRLGGSGSGSAARDRGRRRPRRRLAPAPASAASAAAQAASTIQSAAAQSVAGRLGRVRPGRLDRHSPCPGCRLGRGVPVDRRPGLVRRQAHGPGRPDHPHLPDIGRARRRGSSQRPEPGRREARRDRPGGRDRAGPAGRQGSRVGRRAHRGRGTSSRHQRCPGGRQRHRSQRDRRAGPPAGGTAAPTPKPGWPAAGATAPARIRAAATAARALPPGPAPDPVRATAAAPEWALRPMAHAARARPAASPFDQSTSTNAGRSRPRLPLSSGSSIDIRA